MLSLRFAQGAVRVQVGAMCRSARNHTKTYAVYHVLTRRYNSQRVRFLGFYSGMAAMQAGIAQPPGGAGLSLVQQGAARCSRAWQGVGGGTCSQVQHGCSQVQQGAAYPVLGGNS